MKKNTSVLAAPTPARPPQATGPRRAGGRAGAPELDPRLHANGQQVVVGDKGVEIACCVRPAHTTHVTRQQRPAHTTHVSDGLHCLEHKTKQQLWGSKPAANRLATCLCSTRAAAATGTWCQHSLLTPAPPSSRVQRARGYACRCSPHRRAALASVPGSPTATSARSAVS